MDLLKKVTDIAKNTKYDRMAFLFVLDALNYTLLTRKAQGHISGQILLEGIKEFAIERFGYLGLIVFQQWGLKTTEDFGKIVFILADHKMLGRSEKDSEEDFKNGWDFNAVFKPELTRRHHVPNLEIP